jgi:hypothetical protein
VRRILAIVTPIVGLLAVSWIQTFFSAAAAVSTSACTNLDAAILGQITGIEVLSDTLTQGIGCGTGTDQIYKYVVVIQVPEGAQLTDAGLSTSDFAQLFVGGNVEDCFTNGVFQDLCQYPLANGFESSSYSVTIYAYSEAQWNAVVAVQSDGGVVTAGSVATGSFVNQNFVNETQTPGTAENYCVSITPGNTQIQKYQIPGLVTLIQEQEELLESYAGWTTTCIATQQTDVPVLANCAPLQRTGLTISVGSGDGGGDASDATTGSDGGDASDGSDAADAGDTADGGDAGDASDGG